MSESALSFVDLQVYLATQLGVAYYGAAGDEVAQAPTDTATLATIKDHVNGGIRMFLNDAPPAGWRFQQPTASVVLWATITTGVVTVGGAGNLTLTSASADFHPSMVGHAIVADTSENEYIITAYTSSTVVTVDSDASADTGDTFTLTADGNYTLPSDFGGEFLGPVTYEAATNVGVPLTWTSEGQIRKMRANTSSSSTGTPSMIAVRKMDATDVARRFEMLAYLTPDEDRTVEFPYSLHFSEMTADADLHPAGAQFDEAVLAACAAFAEMKGEDTMAGSMQYYRQFALPGAIRTNSRAAPKRLGSLSKRRVRFENWRDTVPRPNVTT